MKALLVAGARPNFMKIAPVCRAAAAYEKLECLIVHTGQNYDYAMSQTFFDDLVIVVGDVNSTLAPISWPGISLKGL